MFKFMGNMIGNMALSTGSFFTAFLALGCISKLILLLLDNGRYKSLKIYEKIEPIIQDINRRNPKNPDARNEQITKVLLNNKCSILSSFTDVLLCGFAIVVLFVTLRDPENYLFTSTALSSLPTGNILCPDVTLSVIDSYTRYGMSVPLLASLIFPVATFTLNVYHDSILMKKSIISQDSVYYIQWALLGAALLGIGEGFAVLFFAKRVLDMLHYLYTMKFVKVRRVVDATGKPYKLKEEQKDDIKLTPIASNSAKAKANEDSTSIEEPKSAEK